MGGKIKTLTEPKIVKLESFKVMGAACETTMVEKDVRIPRLMEEFHTKQMITIENRLNAPVSYGVFIDPEDWNPDTEPFTWIAAVEVDGHDNLPSGMVSRTFDEQDYAALDYDPDEHNFDPYPFLHKWINDNGYEQISGYGFERYEPYTGANTKFTLYLPVKRMTAQD
ncbi:GyrI-like domain-containing protein [Thalassobacillus devorans]|uniref:GyrI-like domain-containing protein n=1 Tax=Thalassobacillus devorans TaxID=279813 RepID=UPI000A1CCAC9|nr:GyrI-like domain-containing protein [Thalassobacillus devorans]